MSHYTFLGVLTAINVSYNLKRLITVKVFQQKIFPLTAIGFTHQIVFLDFLSQFDPQWKPVKLQAGVCKVSFVALEKKALSSSLGQKEEIREGRSLAGVWNCLKEPPKKFLSNVHKKSEMHCDGVTNVAWTSNHFTPPSFPLRNWGKFFYFSLCLENWLLRPWTKLLLITR